MNFKTLTAMGAAATVAGVLAAPQAEADGTAWIYDSSGSESGVTGTYSRATSNSSGSTGWRDVYGFSQFDTSAIKVEWSGTNVTFTTYTNYTYGGFGSGSSAIPLADWFFDLDNNGTFDYAFSPTSGTSGDLITVDSTRNSVTAMAGLGYTNGSGVSFTEYTAVCSNNGTDCQNNARAPEVDAVTNDLAILTTGISDGSGGTLPSFPLGTGVYAHSYSFTLMGINDGTYGNWDTLRAFWGTGWCANDTIEGSVSNVPIPAAAWLFGSAILGLGAVGWKRRSSAA